MLAFLERAAFRLMFQLEHHFLLAIHQCLFNILTCYPHLQTVSYTKLKDLNQMKIS
jgi:hypothetical protein